MGDKKETSELSELLQERQISVRRQIGIVWRLSVPAILAQTVSIAMQYIDAAMVGSLGAQAAASIGLVASTTWLFGGMCSCFSAGFSVQTAQHIGRSNAKEGAYVMRQGLLVVFGLSVLTAFIGVMISGRLPVWLGADPAIRRDAGLYFLIYVCTIPVMQLNSIAASMLQCSGNMRVPGFLQGCMCILDVIFNMLFIFPARKVSFLGISFTAPGLGLGVVGAALGTSLAQVVIALLMLWMACVKSSLLRIRRGDCWAVRLECLKKAVKIAVPMGAEHIAICGAMVATTRIIAPLGNVAIAANSFGVTAESLCYMPGYGIAAAATTLVGQSIGAARKDLARQFARMSIFLGMAIMSITGILMYFLAPWLFSLLTDDVAVQQLGIKVLRIEVLAEPFYAASIVSSGALRGAGDTFIPGIMNLVSIWGVRITLSVFLVGRLGLVGAWIAMCAELCFRGTIFLVRVFREKWL